MPEYLLKPRVPEYLASCVRKVCVSEYSDPCVRILKLRVPEYTFHKQIMGTESVPEYIGKKRNKRKTIRAHIRTQIRAHPLAQHLAPLGNSSGAISGIPFFRNDLRQPHKGGRVAKRWKAGTRKRRKSRYCEGRRGPAGAAARPARHRSMLQTLRLSMFEHHCQYGALWKHNAHSLHPFSLSSNLPPPLRLVV